MTDVQFPDFRDPEFLRRHVLDTMAFYEGRALDATGGFFQFFKDDGTVYDRRTRHLVSSTRYVFTQAMAWRHFRRPEWAASTRHALAFLAAAHRQPDGGFAWVVDWHDGRATVVDGTNHAYGLAFVLLAHAHALRAGVGEAAAGLEATWQSMECHFWQPAHGLYADEADPQWRLSPYRGQNANMHACEATMAAWRATGERRYLDRAVMLADAVTSRLAARSAGLPGATAETSSLVWEHFTPDWALDPDYHRHDREDIFRPWGFQVGHQAEWAKLLVQLDALAPAPGRLARARALFDAAVRLGWDGAHGGLVYGLAPDGTLHDGDKYHWVQAESLAAAACLAVAVQRAGGPADAVDGYWAWYDRLWAYVWRHFVDHRHGAWYRILAPDNAKLTDEKSPAGKVDYHDMGACYDVLAALGQEPA
jgi:mannose/cellobiose epimerase-like protein (N-acyl-D-glucosamine 2-epimerase family)